MPEKIWKFNIMVGVGFVHNYHNEADCSSGGILIAFFSQLVKQQPFKFITKGVCVNLRLWLGDALICFAETAENYSHSKHEMAMIPLIYTAAHYRFTHSVILYWKPVYSAFPFASGATLSIFTFRLDSRVF